MLYELKLLKIINNYIKQDTSVDFAAPHKSIIFDYFGHAGNANNDYCIPDGPFRNQPLRYPTPHCLRRQWNPDNTIPPWEPPELATIQLQKHGNSVISIFTSVYSEHFKKHLNVGGYAGDIAQPYATNE